MDVKLISLTGLFLSILFPLLAYLKSRREYRNYYSLIWKNSKKLKPSEILGERPYNEIYFQRKIDVQLQRELERRSNVLIVGPPLSGKSRAVFNALKNYRKSFSILVPRAVSFQKFSIPSDFCFWRKKLIFIDDLQYYIEKQDNYHLMFKTAGLKDIPIIATCHSGIEFTKAKNRMTEYNIDIETVFRDVIETGKISEDEAKTFAKSLGIDWGKIIFNGTIGSLFMKLREMEKRYELMSNEEKTILETLKILFAGGVYSDNGIFQIEHIKKAASFFELEGKEYEWRKWLEELENKEFLNILSVKLIKCEEVYLEHIVKPPYIDGSLDSASLLGKIFSEDIDVLVQLGVKIYVSALASASMPRYLHTAADVFNRVLSKGGEMEKRKASFYLGMIHWHLSRVEDTSVNATRAINFFDQCLKFINHDTEPVEYARVSCKKANAYTSLSDVEDSEKNCLKAIEIYLQGLEVFLRFREYSEYAKTLSNLGAAYITLSRFSEPSGNYKKALRYFTEALKYKNETTTEEYAGALNNLAIIYAKLAEIEYPMLNLQKSIDTFEKILDLGLKNKYPERYATALNNLGIVYSSLANIKDEEKNLSRALEYFKQTLIFRDPEKFPVQYSKTVYNIADTYLSLGKIRRSKDDIVTAIEMFSESMRYRGKNSYPFNYALTVFSLGRCYAILATYENKTDNYHKAISLFDEALEIFTEEDYPEMNRKVHEEITAIKKIFFV